MRASGDADGRRRGAIPSMGVLPSRWLPCAGSVALWMLPVRRRPRLYVGSLASWPWSSDSSCSKGQGEQANGDERPCPDAIEVDPGAPEARQAHEVMNQQGD